VELGVPDLDRSAEFYEKIWALTPIWRTSTSCYFRATGKDAYVFALHELPTPRYVSMRMEAASRASVDGLVDRVRRAGGSIKADPASLTSPGGGYGFTFADPEGRDFTVFCDGDRQVEDRSTPDRPHRLSHVVLNSLDMDKATEFFTEALGFRLRDRTAKASFLGCNSDHHSLAITNRQNSKVGHIAFDLPNTDAVMRGCGRLKSAGLPVEWGVGRHGTGDNVFAYYIDPDGFVIEYTSEMEQVDDATYRQGSPQTISRAAHADMWGLAPPPTERFLKALMGPGD
jgi:catechol 2,3-dioxygenase